MRRDTKKIFFYNESGDIIESFEVNKESQIDPSRVIVVTDVPNYTPKSGFYGKMIVKNGKLDYTYIPVDHDRDLTPEQLAQVFEEVL